MWNIQAWFIRGPIVYAGYTPHLLEFIPLASDIRGVVVTLDDGPITGRSNVVLPEFRTLILYSVLCILSLINLGGQPSSMETASALKSRGGKVITMFVFDICLWVRFLPLPLVDDSHNSSSPASSPWS